MLLVEVTWCTALLASLNLSCKRTPDALPCSALMATDLQACCKLLQIDLGCWMLSVVSKLLQVSRSSGTLCSKTYPLPWSFPPACSWLQSVCIRVSLKTLGMVWQGYSIGGMERKITHGFGLAPGGVCFHEAWRKYVQVITRNLHAK